MTKSDDRVLLDTKDCIRK